MCLLSVIIGDGGWEVNEKKGRGWHRPSVLIVAQAD